MTGMEARNTSTDSGSPGRAGQRAGSEPAPTQERGRAANHAAKAPPPWGRRFLCSENHSLGEWFQKAYGDEGAEKLPLL